MRTYFEQRKPGRHGCRSHQQSVMLVNSQEAMTEGADVGEALLGGGVVGCQRDGRVEPRNAIAERKRNHLNRVQPARASRRAAPDRLAHPCQLP